MIKLLINNALNPELPRDYLHALYAVSSVDAPLQFLNVFNAKEYSFHEILEYVFREYKGDEFILTNMLTGVKASVHRSDFM